MSLTEESDERLMAAYVAGDHEAFREIFRRYAPQLFRMMRRHLRSEGEANDMVQQTFLHLHRAKQDFKRDALLRPWLFTIAMNCVREHHRRRGRRKESPLSPEHQDKLEARNVTLEELSESKLRRDRLRDALSRLPANQREVIEMHWFQERPFDEVAKIVGASLSAVKVRAHRGYTRLRELLAEQGSED